MINTVVGCFPTYAIGNIAADEETLPDIMLYVEDLFARDFLNAFYDLFVDEKYGDPTLRPSAKIVPVGGFNEVVGFLDRNRSVLPTSVKQTAVLDADVATETLTQWQNTNNHAKLAKHKELEDYISFLPFTPEVGFMAYAASNATTFEQKLRERYGDNQLQVRSIVGKYNPSLTGSPQRQAAKKSINELMDYLKTRTQGTDEVVREKLSGLFANLQWATYKPDFMTLFGSLT